MMLVVFDDLFIDNNSKENTADACISLTVQQKG